MTLSDTVADLLTRIRNAKSARHKYVDVRFSKINQAIIEVLKKKGYLISSIVNEKKRAIRVFLKYDKMHRQPVIQGLKRISKPGIRRYVSCRDIPKVLSGLGIAILSTPVGILDGETARKNKTGGELLCFVW